jgi:hypothetical protein
MLLTGTPAARRPWQQPQHRLSHQPSTTLPSLQGPHLALTAEELQRAKAESQCQAKSTVILFTGIVLGSAHKLTKDSFE